MEDFANTFVISIEWMKERLIPTLERIKNTGCIDNPRVFDAFVVPEIKEPLPYKMYKRRGIFGCYLSHKAILTMAKALSFEQVVIFEDDVTFEPNFKEIYLKGKEQLPEDWDVLIFGYSLISNKNKYSENLVTSNYIWGGFGYIVHKRAYNRILNELNKYTIASDVQITESKLLKCFQIEPQICSVDKNVISHINYLKMKY